MLYEEAGDVDVEAEEEREDVKLLLCALSFPSHFPFGSESVRVISSSLITHRNDVPSSSTTNILMQRVYLADNQCDLACKPLTRLRVSHALADFAPTGR